MKMLLAGLLAASALMPAVASAEPAERAGAPAKRVPDQLDAAQRAGYRAIFTAIRESRWTDAQVALDSIKPGPLHTIARAELALAKGSPPAETDQLIALIGAAPELPEAPALARIAATRGATGLPMLPEPQKLYWVAGASTRGRAKATKTDLVAATLALKMQPLVKADDGIGADALLESTEGLSPEGQTEWQQRVAWMYYLAGDDANARKLAARARVGAGADWAVQGEWVGALAAWRQGDCNGAGKGFEAVAARAGDVELRAAGLYWAARADMRCGRPEKVENRLKLAATLDETFYGLLARQALGVKGVPRMTDALGTADWARLATRPNVRVAAALVEIGETDLAGTVLRQQAKIGPAGEYPALVRIVDALDLPDTLMWMGNNAPAGAGKPPAAARFPAPKWVPDGGWRVDKALVYAHTLQESRFRPDVTSPAGAYGLMQIMPAVALDYSRATGISLDRSQLKKPSVNMAVGQALLEKLRDQPCTGGLLPKVIAAYNAGPAPVGTWNGTVKDGGDPLLYIESIPYWETRGYVMTVLRNYWMYEGKGGKLTSNSRAALAQGMWPKFPGMNGPSAVRLTPTPSGVRLGVK